MTKKKIILAIGGGILGVLALVILIGIVVIKSIFPKDVYSEDGLSIFYSKDVEKIVNSFSSFEDDLAINYNLSLSNKANKDSWSADWEESLESLFLRAFPKDVIEEGYYGICFHEDIIIPTKVITVYIEHDRDLAKKYRKKIKYISNKSWASIFDVKDYFLKQYGEEFWNSMNDVK